MKVAAFIFMLIGTVASIFTIGWFSLLWTVPMTFWYGYKTVEEENVSVAFKVCCLLFVNTIAGIIMLCDYKHD